MTGATVIGKTLGHYQITNQLGKGGMGEVYQAKDQVLGREVAIKVLPEEFARDADRVARFQREAKVLASLNHPNIAAIHGLEQSGGINFLVLELVEGQTLADRIKSGPIAVKESLKLALQIAEALEAAHERGVIHRDLKPSNIKVTPDGEVKVLDFGLAKAYAGDREEINLSNSPTLSDAATQQGVILGTAAYMSPEQARGKAVDKRADIWAFGCVLYEMLTGRVAFRGEDVSEILASVIKGDVKLDLLPANLHPRVREAIIRCLHRDLRIRYSSITDARYEIEQALADPSGALVQPGTELEPRRKLRTILPWAAATLVLGLIIAEVAVWKLKPAEPRQVMRFDCEVPEDQQLDGSGNPFLAISSDGSKFVYNTDKGLFLRSINQPAARRILDADKLPKQPFFSPDGQWIGYWSQAENQLKKISVSGGTPVTLANTAGNPVLPSWWIDDTIVYGQYGTSKVFRVPASGGTPQLFWEGQRGFLFGPQVLPGGKSVLFTRLDGTEYRVMVQSLESGLHKLMAIRGTVSRYLPTGHLVYMVGNNLFAVPFDLGRLEATGGPVPMVEGIEWLGATAAPGFAVSNSGTLVYVTGTSRASYGRTLVWVDKEGREEALHTPPNYYQTPKISPDGKRVALAISTDGTPQIWIWDLTRETMTKLTFDKSASLRPIWTRDGRRIVFISIRDGKYSIDWKAADGTGEVEKIGSAPDKNLLPYSWSSDGKTLAVEEMDSDMVRVNIGTQSIEGDHARKTLLHEAHSQAHPNISPDGKYMAYFSDESGRWEVYVRPFPEVNKGKWQISTGGGESPLWSPDGRELFYRNGGAVMAVPVDTKTTFNAGKPRMLFQGAYPTGYGESPAYDISPDSKRFLMIKEPQPAASAGQGPRKINVAVNWSEELKQRVPVK